VFEEGAAATREAAADAAASRLGSPEETLAVEETAEEDSEGEDSVGLAEAAKEEWWEAALSAVEGAPTEGRARSRWAPPGSGCRGSGLDRNEAREGG
jgi:hypothetical protein